MFYSPQIQETILACQEILGKIFGLSENPARAETIHVGVDKCHRTSNDMQR